MKPTLLVLAAGMGSRYGGLKQIDPVGPSGETILDYSLFDAIRAGFGRVVFVIRREFEAEFRSRMDGRFESQIEIGYAFQELDDLPAGFATPAGRTKPWGTGHAIWCARDEVHTPFAAINADDFYGAAAYCALAGFFAAPEPEPPHRFAMVGYRLGLTLSEHGTVSRGVCETTAEGLLRDITECTRIERHGNGGTQIEPDGAERSFDGNETVSMNFWGFTPAIFPLLGAEFAAFLELRGQEEKSEFYIPTAVAAMMAAGHATVRVLQSEAPWFGITYRDDKPIVADQIVRLVAAGEYPTALQD